MKKVALLISDNLLPDGPETRDDRFEYVEEVGTLTPALAAEGIELVSIRWRDAAAKAAEFDAMLPLMVWDYFEGNEAAFLSEMAKAEQTTKLFNNFKVLKWNANKSYLDELEASGAPVIHTVTVDRVTEANVTKAFDKLGTDMLVIKPQVGGGAWRQVLYKKGDPFPSKDQLPPDAALIQDFLPSVQTEGEFSFLYFGGAFSHAVLKQAKPGDYRIQSLYGGTETPYTPTSDERESARSVLDSLDFTPLYARVDLLRGRDGRLRLIELEMLEPYLYLPHAKVGNDGLNKGAVMFAKALAKRLGR
ncbi:RimK family alpha-L-glutamate ligase [Litorimonas sp. RW-G-Af-16]|uniref:ATP-grasp domain-containing protein n=1 Tax=Litorimonas sp. RW-G-Af-16 TaxID=3241168 RepID=UPI003AAB3BF5